MPVEIIAEIGINHCGKVDAAMALADSVKNAGADFVKFQKFGMKTHPKLEQYMLSGSEWSILFEHCRNIGIEPFASVFHPNDVEFMEALGVERYKVAKEYRYNKDLFESIEKTCRPTYVSMSTNETNDYEDKIKLHCVGKYPTNMLDTELSRVPLFDGYSSHTGIINDCVAAAALGSVIIEAHVMQEDCNSPDAESSLSVDQFTVMVNLIRRIQCQ